MSAVSFVALPVTAAVIWLLLRTGLAARATAVPRVDSWSARPTPVLGGIGIAAGIAAGVLAAAAAGVVELQGELLGILAGCAIVFTAGLADDVLDLGPLPKLAAQLAAAGVVLWAGLSVTIVGNDTLALLLALVWLVGLTNAFNLLDNMDGLAATLAGIACLYFAIDAFRIHRSYAGLVLALSVGTACLGFLPFNVRPRKPAAIYMGDSGSQVLGFALAALGLYSTHEVAGTTVATLALPILVLAVPMFDTALVTVVRLLERRPIHEGGRDHASHRLVYQGLTEKRALLLLAVVSAALGATSLAYDALDDPWVTTLGVLVTFAALVQFGSFIGQVERGDRDVDETWRGWLVHTFVVHRQRLVEVVVDGALLGASFLAASLLLGLAGSGEQRHVLEVSFSVLLFFRYATFIPFGLYSGVWRHAGARDAVSVVSAVAVSTVLALGVLRLRGSFDVPVDLFVLDALLATALVGVSRFGERALVTALGRLRDAGGRRTLIVGAGRAGRSLLRELREVPGERVVGFVDDDPALWRRRLQGVRVLGGTAGLPLLIAESRPDAVLVTIPDAPRDQLDAIVRACGAAGVPCRFVRRETVDPEAVLGALAK